MTTHQTPDRSHQPPDFSRWAKSYADARPGYPSELFAHLASLVDRRDIAWDCGTGSGQAARGLVEHFGRVIATDRGEGQIAHAEPHPRIDYRVAPAEQSGLGPASVDLISVAQALHWFDFDAFFAEARRVLRPRGVLAAYAYHLTRITPQIDEVVERFYWDVVRPHFPQGTQYVDNSYATIAFPGDPLPEVTFSGVMEWTLPRFLAFVETWSGTRRYLEVNGANPVESLAVDLAPVWGDASRPVEFPLFVKAVRL